MTTSRLLVAILNRFQPSAATVVLGSAIAVGVVAGSAVTVFRKSILWAEGFYWQTLLHWLTPIAVIAVAVVPVLGALLVALMHWWAERLPQANAEQINLGQTLLRAMMAVVSLGAGASLGPEGPSVELGSQLARWLGQQVQFSTERTRLLMAAGAAAGLAAGFNAPIAGVFFALEVSLRSVYGTGGGQANTDISAVVLAAVLSAIIAQVGLGPDAAFHLPVYELRSYGEYIFYIGLGVLCSGVAIAFNRSLAWMKASLTGTIPPLLKLLLGGWITGMVALFLPEVLGVGYETVEGILQGAPFSIPLLGQLLVGKLLLTALCLGSGFVGGIFAPAIFLGAVLGALYATALPLVLPDSVVISAPPAYALMGMAAILAGTVRAPLTSVLLLFELTRDYRIVLPLMASAGFCSWLVEQVYPAVPVAPAVAAASQESAIDLDVLSNIKIAEVMTLNPLCLKSQMPLLQAAQFVTSGYYHSVLVLDENNHLSGILTTQDIKRALSAFPQRSPESLIVADAYTAEVLYTYADETLAAALKRMAARDLRQLPVVDRHQTKRVIGVVDRQAIATAHATALTKRAIAEKISAHQKLDSIEPERPTADTISANVSPDLPAVPIHRYLQKPHEQGRDLN
ncbi:MAG: CBS domain-containing protein [Oscillatoriales cyanobacterium SM2_2_1]|nr:CBS domain-containing protein [Oscillatoriales cyanobacterium SM2_2_1]